MLHFNVSNHPVTWRNTLSLYKVRFPFRNLIQSCLRASFKSSIHIRGIIYQRRHQYIAYAYDIALVTGAQENIYNARENSARILPLHK